MVGSKAVFWCVVRGVDDVLCGSVTWLKVSLQGEGEVQRVKLWD